MKRKIYKRIFILVSLCSTFALQNMAQTILYNETFDADSTQLPTGWIASPVSGWKISTTNVSTGYVGASGLYNLDISNATGVSGDFEVTSKTFTTNGYKNISLIYAARNTTHFSDSGSTISGFSYSTDNGTSWNSIPYTENPNNSTWSLINGGVRLSLPIAENQATVQLKWTAHLQSTSSGTYRIDDLNVQGDLISGIRENNPDAIIKIASGTNNTFHLVAAPLFKFPADALISVYDITGKIVFSQSIGSNNFMFSLANAQAGIYTVKVSSGDLLFTQKISCF